MLKAGGRFAFNVPVIVLDDRHGSREEYPSLLEEMRVVAARLRLGAS
jgi:hypothetical protein